MAKLPRSCGTHDGTFHADEVTACALLLLLDLIDEAHIVRTRDPAVLSTCEYVCDVGGIYDPSRKLFDHHQVDYVGEMSSAGMVLLFLKDLGLLDSEEYQFFYRTLVAGVDAHDNGRAPPLSGTFTFSMVVSNFTPVHYDASPEEQFRAFAEAVQFAHGHLKRMWTRYKYVRSCRQVVDECMQKYKECLVFEEGIPWVESFFDLGGRNHPALFVVMPSGNHWKLRGVPPTLEERMKVRVPLPNEWAGRLDEELRKISGIPGAVFCHKERFISVWETKEDAMKALEYVLASRKESR